MAVPIVATMEEERIVVRFDFDAVVLGKIKSVPGAKFKSREKGGPYWYFPKEVQALKDLKHHFGKTMSIEGPLRGWAVEEIARAEHLSSLALADAAPLERLPLLLPDLWRAVQVGPKGRGWSREALDDYIAKNPKGSYQTADVSYLANALNPLNGSQPGLGKTIETIASIFEAGQENGPHLVLAPMTSLESVWKTELEMWQPYPVWMCEGSTSDRQWAINDFLCTEGPGWLVCNHHMAQGVRDKDSESKMRHRFPDLYDLEWNTVILDEIHKAGFRDTSSLLFRGINGLPAKKKMAISGTPIGGKPINLWIILHWLHPESFASKWRWAERWLNIRDNGYGKEIGTIREDLEEAFYDAHAAYFLRRLKSECLPDLPPKQAIDVWVNMEPTQEKQYKEFALAAEVRIEDEVLSATSILAEYTRLKQFAIAHSTIEYFMKDGDRHFRPVPTEESCKLDSLEELLTERGIFDEGGDEQVVIFSQFSKVVDMVYDWLAKKKVRVTKLTGATNKRGQRAEIQRAFQAGEDKVICMTTTAGGVSITLDRADTVIFMDETWTPDDQEQASDRIHRASRNHQVTVYTIRTRGTIEHYIQERLLGKENINKIILDLRRQGLRAVASGTLATTGPTRTQETE